MFAPQGAMTIYEAVQHKAALLAALEGADVLEVDLGGVCELDSAGIQLLLLARREVLQAGGRIVLLDPSQEAEEALGRYRLRDLFDAGATGHHAGTET